MLEKVDPRVRERPMQQALDHVVEYLNPTAAALVVTKCNR